MTTSRSTDAIPATSDERWGGNCEYNNQKDDDNYGDNGGGGEEEEVAARSYTTIKYDDDNYGDRGGGRGDGARHQDCWESGGSVNGRFIGGHGAGGGEVVINDRVNGAVRCFGLRL